MRRALPTALVFLLLTGCEQQEAVPLSRSVPVALLQLAVLLGSVLGGYAALERGARRRRVDTGAPAPRGFLGVAGAVVFGLVAVLVLGYLALVVATAPATYAEETTSVFSWDDTVAFAWLLMIPVVPFALFELRLAAACWARRPWAEVAAAIQFALLTLGVLWGLAGTA